MTSATGLLTLVPIWYISCLLFPFSAGALTLVPAAGVLSLGVGALLGVMHRQRALLLFFVPFALSEFLLAVAGVMRGQMREGVTAPSLVNVVDGALLVFVVIQLSICGYLIYRVKGARSSAVALSVFSITYAGFALFVAGMSFSDSWI